MPARQTFRVYLAGPISRCNDAQMRRWRETVKGEYGSKMTFLDPVERLVDPEASPDVCRRLRIPLRHHDAGSDVEACARIVLAAEADKMTPADLSEAQRCARELEAASDAHGYFGRTSHGLVVGGIHPLDQRAI